MRNQIIVIVLIFSLLNCGEKDPDSLVEFRDKYPTELVQQVFDEQRNPLPPDGFEILPYPTDLGLMWAVLTKPEDDQVRPCIVWVTGGLPPGGPIFEKGPAEDDQSAEVFREAGLIVCYPSFRGTAGNPGFQEGFYGEVKDLVQLYDSLKARPNIDPDRIFLGGHSTGGTLVLLAAAMTDQYKAVFSFGPVDDPEGYGEEPLHANRKHEFKARAPIYWLHNISVPTFVIEGDTSPSNYASLFFMQEECENPAVTFLVAENADHFSVLRPANQLIAKKLMKPGPLSLTSEELNRAIAR